MLGVGGYIADKLMVSVPQELFVSTVVTYLCIDSDLTSDLTGVGGDTSLSSHQRWHSLCAGDNSWWIELICEYQL